MPLSSLTTPQWSHVRTELLLAASQTTSWPLRSDWLTPVIRWGESKGEQVRCSDLLEAQERETFDLTWQYTLLLSPLPSGEITSWTKTRQHHSLQVGWESRALTHGMSLTFLIGCFCDLFNIFITRRKIIFWAQSSIIILMRSDITTCDS